MRGWGHGRSTGKTKRAPKGARPVCVVGGQSPFLRKGIRPRSSRSTPCVDGVMGGRPEKQNGRPKAPVLCASLGVRALSCGKGSDPAAVDPRHAWMGSLAIERKNKTGAQRRPSCVRRWGSEPFPAERDPTPQQQIHAMRGWGHGRSTGKTKRAPKGARPVCVVGGQSPFLRKGIRPRSSRSTPCVDGVIGGVDRKNRTGAQRRPFCMRRWGAEPFPAERDPTPQQ